MRRHSWTCFPCRRTIKGRVPQSSDEVLHLCPECGQPMHYMGDAFKPPRRHQDVQWRKVEMLWRAGHVFWHNTGPWPLKTLRHAREALAPQRPQRGDSVLKQDDGRR